MTKHTLSVYDLLRPHLSAEDVLRRVGIDVVRKIGSEAYCKPICHESTSGESLQVNLHTGRWLCRSCSGSGVFGDLIQLVEYAQTGGRAPAHQSQQKHSPTHREALRWLCEQYAVPFDERRTAPSDPALDVVHVFAMAAHDHLKRAPEVLSWIQEKWGFDLATVEGYGIGFMPSPILPSIAVEANRTESRGAFQSSGLGFFPPGASFATRFEGRVTFPYLDGSGQAVYLIGRATPWTPKREDGRVAKYHKLSVHSEQRPYVSKKITNDHLYNESVMEEAQVVVVAEGVADAVALSSIGVPVVSPVTISFNEVDLERFVRKCSERRIQRVEILFDNELSGSGNYGALRVARKLLERGICSIVLTLPLGATQTAARDEVLNLIGREAFEELERADPRRRKEIIAERVTDEAAREWVARQVEASKIDAAEWVAMEGAAAAQRFAEIRRAGVDPVAAEAAEVAKAIDPESPAQDRAAAFEDVVRLAASVDDRLVRGEYASSISKAAGKGVTKADIAARIAAARRLVKEERAGQEEAPSASLDEDAIAASLILLPPDAPHAQPLTPSAPADPAASSAIQVPPAPGTIAAVPGGGSEHEKYAPVRDSVMRAVEKKMPEEAIGKHVAQTITLSMGFTPFRTPEELVLVRGNERVDLGSGHATPAFRRLLYLASGLTVSKTSHRGYIDAAAYFLDLGATKAHDVSWSYYDQPTGTVFFPTGDAAGSIFSIARGAVYRTRMSDARVPAVAGQTFRPIRYAEDCAGAIEEAFDTLKWVSLSPGDRLILTYWVACLPILRKVGEVPIVRVEGGSSSGKSRTVDAVAVLVNGYKTSTVPTAAAMTSRLSTEMLTVDDNRESRDMTDSLRSTLLQATGLGAREKRRANSDTGTVVERVCGALLMNGIEPIHDGRSELASRLLTLRSDSRWRSADSPRAEEVLHTAMLAIRDRFWSESVFRCAQAIDLDARWGESLGLEIEAIFGSTRIGRLSVYLRLMYLAWVSSQPVERQPEHLDRIAPAWIDAFSDVGGCALQSLMHEELAVSAMRYAFAFASKLAQPVYVGSDERLAFEGRYKDSTIRGDAVLGPVSSSQLARIVRSAAKDMNAPKPLAVDLSAGQLLARIQDGLGFLEDAGFRLEFLPTARGKVRMTVYRPAGVELPPSVQQGQQGLPGVAPAGGDTWVGESA